MAKETISLYELPRDKGIIIRGFQNGEGEDIDITFHHIDGMYSYCTVNGLPDGEDVVHLSVLTPLRKVEEGIYMLVTNHKSDE